MIGNVDVTLTGWDVGVIIAICLAVVLLVRR